MIAEQMIDCFWDLSIFTLQSRSPSSPSEAKRLSWLVVPILNAQLKWKRLKLVRCVPWNGCFSVVLTTNFCRWFGYCLNGLSLVYARIWSLSWHLNYRYVTVCKSFWVALFVCQQSTPPKFGWRPLTVLYDSLKGCCVAMVCPRVEPALVLCERSIYCSG